MAEKYASLQEERYQRYIKQFKEEALANKRNEALGYEYYSQKDANKVFLDDYWGKHSYNGVSLSSDAGRDTFLAQSDNTKAAWSYSIAASNARDKSKKALKRAIQNVPLTYFSGDAEKAFIQAKNLEKNLTYKYIEDKRFKAEDIENELAKGKDTYFGDYFQKEAEENLARAKAEQANKKPLKDVDINKTANTVKKPIKNVSKKAIKDSKPVKKNTKEKLDVTYSYDPGKVTEINGMAFDDNFELSELPPQEFSEVKKQVEAGSFKLNEKQPKDTGSKQRKVNNSREKENIKSENKAKKMAQKAEVKPFNFGKVGRYAISAMATIGVISSLWENKGHQSTAELYNQ